MNNNLLFPTNNMGYTEEELHMNYKQNSIDEYINQYSKLYEIKSDKIIIEYQTGYNEHLTNLTIRTNIDNLSNILSFFFKRETRKYKIKNLI